MSVLKEAIHELDTQIQDVVDRRLATKGKDENTIDWYTSSMEDILTEIQPSMNDYMSKRTSEIPENEWYCMYFNNYHLRLPFSLQRETLKNYREHKFSEDSEKTFGQLWDDIDILIEKCEIDIDKIKTLVTNVEGNKQTSEKHLIERKELFELVFPVYVGLKLIGYTNPELG